MNIDFAYYRSIFWRRFPYFAVIASIMASIGLTIAMVLPPEYEARATLLVESPQIPDELASSTVRTSPTELLEIIEQRLMTRANLIDTAERLNVYDRRGDEPVRASEIVTDMRGRTTFRADSGRNRATLMSITFRATDPRTAAQVTNEFVTLVLQENVEMRTNVAGETLEFFEQEVERLGSALDAQSAQILEFRSAAGQALPENQSLLLERQQSLQDRLSLIERETGQVDEQKARILDIFSDTRGQFNEAAATPRERALIAAREELDAALLVYSETAPRVRLLKARIAQLEERVQNEALNITDEPTDAVDPAEQRVQQQVDELDSRVDLLLEEAVSLRATIAQIDTILAQIPANGLTLEALKREHNNLQGRYSQVVDRLSKAQTGERIELLSKGQRITIIEQATPPDNPTKPNRLMIAGTGAAAGIALGLSFVVLLELLNRSIRRPSEIVDRLGITPIAVLPYIRTDSEIAWRRILIVLMLCGFVVVIPLGLYLVHSFVLPLDGFVNSILQRFGFTLPGGLG